MDILLQIRSSAFTGSTLPICMTLMIHTPRCGVTRMNGKEGRSMQNAIELFGMLVADAAPYAVVFALGQRLVTLFLGMAFKGEIVL